MAPSLSLSRLHLSAIQRFAFSRAKRAVALYTALQLLKAGRRWKSLLAKWKEAKGSRGKQKQVLRECLVSEDAAVLVAFAAAVPTAAKVLAKLFIIPLGLQRSPIFTFAKWLFAVGLSFGALKTPSFQRTASSYELSLLARVLDAAALYFASSPSSAPTRSTALPEAGSSHPRKKAGHSAAFSFAGLAPSLLFVALQAPLVDAIVGGSIHQMDKGFVNSVYHWIEDITEVTVRECFGYDGQKKGNASRVERFRFACVRARCLLYSQECCNRG